MILQNDHVHKRPEATVKKKKNDIGPHHFKLLKFDVFQNPLTVPAKNPIK